MRKYLALAALLLAGCSSAPEQPKENAQTAPHKHDHSAIQKSADSITASIDAKVAFAFINIETGDTFSYHGDDHKPTQSTAKFPLALLVMHLVDSGKLSLSDSTKIPAPDLSPKFHSSMRDSLYGRTTVSLHEMMYYMITMSDNASCNMFAEMVGGPANIVAYARRQGMGGLSLVPAATRQIIDFSRPYDNWCTATDMAQLLARFYTGHILSKTSTDTLRNIMERTSGGKDRIRGLLPENTIVAHKTGTGEFTNGFFVNDIGIITLPNGNHLVLAVYVSDAKADMEACARIIARIAKACYDTQNS